MKRDNSFASMLDDSLHGGKKLFTHKGARELPDGTLRCYSSCSCLLISSVQLTALQQPGADNAACSQLLP